MEEYAYTRTNDSEDDLLDMPLVRRAKGQAKGESTGQATGGAKGTATGGATKSRSRSSSDEDIPLVRKRSPKKNAPQVAAEAKKSPPQEEFFVFEDIEEQLKEKSKQLPKRKVIDYTKTSLGAQIFEPPKKKYTSVQKSPKKSIKSPAKKKAQAAQGQEEQQIGGEGPSTGPSKTYSEEECEAFISAASKVQVKEKFMNPITKKEITKGSAAYNKYIKDCQAKLTVETKESMKKEKETETSKFGQRKVYRCEDYKTQTTGSFEPNPHQIKARNRFGKILDKQVEENIRGLLLYYGLGSGKTCTYAMIADLYHKKFPDRPIFVFTPGSLRTNFLEQYCSFCGMNPKDVAKYFAFYSINDTSILKKLPKKLPPSLVIVDEVHKLTHGKSNDSPIISLIYDVINNSDDVNIVSGSGTPIETNLEELFYLTNLHIKDKFDIMPDFKSMFKWKEGVFYPKNKDKFLELFGSYISYYDPQKRLESSNKKSFPTVYYKNVYVPINPEREMAFIDIVNEENERMKKPNEELKFRDYEKYKKQKQNYFIATSRLKSSQYSNFYYPVLDSKKYKPGTEKAEKEEEEQKETSDLPVSIEDGGDDNLPRNAFPTGTPMNIGVPDKLKEEGGWITKQLLEDLYDQGEKIKQIVDDIETHEGKHAVYTRFKTYFGSRLLGAILDLKEIPYVYFDGDMDDKDRVRILEQFNSPENINGDKIKVIILTSAGSAGINLKEIRRFHILEQYFNLSYLKQVVGRGNRYLSHQRLPENKRNLTVLNYFLQLSDDELTNNYSSDVLSFKKGKDKDNSISNVRELLQNLDI
jgi:hypothetical protein